MPGENTTQYCPGGRHADAATSVQLPPCTLSGAVSRLTGHVRGTSATKARGPTARRSVTLATPSLSVSATVTAQPSRSPVHAPVPVTPVSNVPHTRPEAGKFAADSPAAQGSFVRTEQGSASGTDSGGQL